MLRYVPSEASRVGLRFIVPDDVDEVTVVQELHRKKICKIVRELLPTVNI